MLWWIFWIGFHTGKHVHLKPLLYTRINLKNRSGDRISIKSRNSSWTYSKPAYSCPKALQNSSWKDITAVTDVKIGGEGLRTGCFHVNRFATSLRLNWSFFDEASQYRQKLKMKVAWERLLWTASYQINIDQLPIKMATSFWTFLLLQCWKPLQDWIEHTAFGSLLGRTYRRASSQTNLVSLAKKPLGMSSLYAAETPLF